MAVSLNLSELGFRRPFTREVTQILRLSNPAKDPVAFKVKTTAPKQYCVRPNSGRIEPNGAVEVQVLLQAMREEPPADAKCKDKFLVQSIAITPERDLGNVQAIWQNVEKTAKDAVEEKKIRVIFLPAETAPLTPHVREVNGLHPGDHSTGEQETTSPAYSSPAAEEGTGTRSSKTGGTQAASNAGSAPQIVQSAASNVSAAAATTANTVSDIAPSSTQELKAQLLRAQETISKLTEQVQEQGLRQRKSRTTEHESSPQATLAQDMPQVPADGVPVQMVAALCLLSFLLAYFFF